MKKRDPETRQLKKTNNTRPRRKLVPVSEEMREWSAMMESELNGLPGIKTKTMFGFQTYYRHGKIFAAIPRTRGFGTPNSLMVKFLPMPKKLLERSTNDTRLTLPTRMPGNGWHGFEVCSEKDIRDALWWLSQAHAAIKR
jgi:hypothetical protein